MPNKFSNIHTTVKWQFWVLLVSSFLMAAKFLAYFITNSNAILTDALESIVNVLAGLLALYSLWLASQPKDENHPYGHGKIEFVSSAVEGSLILIAGSYMIGKSVYNFFEPVEIQNLDIGIWITSIAGIFNYVAGAVAEKLGKKVNSIVLEAEGKHLKSDAYTTLGMLVGLTVVFFTDILWLDNVIAILFGGMIAFIGYKIIKKSMAGIMDEADLELITEILSIINSNRRTNWIDLHNLRIIKYGSRLHIDAHMTVPWYLNVEQAHDEIEKIDELVNTKQEQVVEFFVHVDPCVSQSCKICQKQNCDVRKNEFERKIEWKLENVIVDKKHHL